MSSKISETLDKLADKKKLKSKIKALRDLISKGNKKNGIEGTNEIYAKAFYALKDTKKIPLNRVNISMFGEYGFLRASNFFIAKSGNSFTLFKAREVDVIDKTAEKKLTKTAKELAAKHVKTKKDMEQITKDVPFVEWKPLSKSDMIDKLYQESKNNKKLYAAIAAFFNKDKLLKKDFESLSFGDMQYIAQKEVNYLKDTQFKHIMDNYHLNDIKDELRLARSADKELIKTMDFQEIKQEVDEIAASTSQVQYKISQIRSGAIKVEDKSATLVALSMDLLAKRDRLGTLDVELDKIMDDPSQEQIMEIVSETTIQDDKEEGKEKGKPAIGDFILIQKDDLSFVGKEPDPALMKLGLGKSDQVARFFAENPEYGEKLEVESKKEVVITNYGVFSGEEPSKALQNLLSYANSLNEMVNNHDAQLQKTQENSGNFAI